MVFVKTSHDMQKCHMCRSLECKEDRLELIFGGNFCQLQLCFKIQVHSTRIQLESALVKKLLKKTTHECDVFMNSMLIL